MGRTVIAAVFIVVLASDATDALGRTDSVRMRVAPSRITAGQSVLVIAGVSPARALCNGTISHAAKTVKLKPRKAVGGAVSWTAKIPGTAPGGRWIARVVCAHAGSATARFTVIARPPPPPPTIPAKVVVVKAGLSGKQTCKFCSTTFVSFGVVVQNASPDEDALGVKLTLNFLDSNGLIVHSDSSGTYDVPAGATYYVGGYYSDFESTSGVPTKMEVASVQMSNHQKKAIGGLPPVANIRASDTSGTAHILGDFQNPYTKTIDDFAPVTVVCYDAAGNIIGGGSGHPNASVTPGGRTGFDVTVYSLTAAQIASTQVSVGPSFTS